MSNIKLALPLNKEGNMESIGPVSGIMALAERRGLDCEVVLYNPSDVDVTQLVNTPEMASKSEAAYSTDDYSDDEIPSIMEHALQKTVRKRHQAHVDRQALRMQEEAHMADRKADEACPDPDIQAHERFLEDRQADAVRQQTIDGLINPSEVDTPETSPEDDFWDEPDSETDDKVTDLSDFRKKGELDKTTEYFYRLDTSSGLYQRIANPDFNQTCKKKSEVDRMLTTPEVCEIIFGDSSEEHMKKMYQVNLKRHCKPVQVGGKRTKMWWSEKAVRSYLRKFTNRCGGSNVVFNAH